MDIHASSAGRLFSLLSRGRPENGNQICLQVWAKILGIQNRTELLRRVGRLFLLPDVVREDVLQLKDVDHELFLTWYPSVDNAFTGMKLEGHWSEFQQHMDPTVLQALRFCADRLERDRPEPVINKTQLEALRSEVESLITEISKANLPDDARKLLNLHLRAVRNSLDDYEVWGLEPLKRALEGMCGASITEPKAFGEVQRSGYWDRFKRVAGALLLVLKIADAGASLEERLGHLLPRPDSNDDATFEAHEPESDDGVKRVPDGESSEEELQST